MIKLALAIGFLSVFGLVGYAIVARLTKNTEDTSKIKQTKQETNE